MRNIFFGFILFLSSCQTVSPTPEPQIVDVYATLAAQPWLRDVYDCSPNEALIRLVNDPASADISLRIGEPDFWPASVFQIDTEEILVVTHRQSPVQNLTMDEVRELFADAGEPPVQVWVFAEGEDVQRNFEQTVMQGRSVTSLARLATSPQQMSDTINNTPNTVGILPKHWKVGDSRFVYTIPDVPVLALVNEKPQGAIREIIACLQM